jgi:hypothetical protein
MGYDVEHHFPQYISYIVAVSFLLMEEIRILGENHRHAYKSLTHFIT